MLGARRRNSRMKDKKKPPYSLRSNVAMALRMIRQYEPRWFGYSAVRLPVRLGISLADLYLAPVILALISGGAGAGKLILAICGLCGASVLLKMLEAGLAYLCGSSLGIDIAPRLAGCTAMTMKKYQTDYPNLNSPAFQDAANKSLEAFAGNPDCAGQAIYRTFFTLADTVLGLAAYTLVLANFSLPILLLIILFALAGFLAKRASNRWTFEHRDAWAPIDRKISYVANAAGDFSFAKDIRLFGMADWLRELFQSLCALRDGWHRKEKRVWFWADAAGALAVFLRNGAAYGALIAMTAAGELTASGFILYFSAVGSFSAWVLTLLEQAAKLHQQSLDYCEFRTVMDYPEHFRREGGAPVPRSAPEIRISGLRFSYPGSDREILKGIDLTVKPGEKIALVGLNGAGKSTFIQLLCGLYDPTGGEILVDGKPISAYNRQEYYEMISAVFQESVLLPMSVLEMISCRPEEEADRGRARRCLELAELWEKVESLPQGLDTKLRRDIYYDGADLSGGETQKLMLARALYRDAPLLLLDEPTAALDPIAESEIYRQYHEMSAGKTSFYISHRLASTRFCDRILLLEDGVIAEEGTHAELMRRKGKYYALYEIQSAYYREGGSADEEN